MDFLSVLSVRNGCQTNIDSTRMCSVVSSSQYAKKLAGIGAMVVPFMLQFATMITIGPLHNQWYWILVVIPAEVGILFGAMAFFTIGFHLWRAKAPPSEVHIQIAGPKTGNPWATYYHPISVIEVHGSGKDEQLQTEYCKTIIGIDHEYLHHVLFMLEGKTACEALDNLAGNLLDHCRWVGLKLLWEGRTGGFWNRIDP